MVYLVISMSKFTQFIQFQSEPQFSYTSLLYNVHKSLIYTVYMYEYEYEYALSTVNLLIT